jgi:hypothetical protein
MIAMRIFRKSYFGSIVALAVLSALGSASSRAASVPSSLDANRAVLQQAQPEPVEWLEVNRRKLRHAYWLLEQADRDYRGHRVKAMEAIRKAGGVIGLDLHGDGYGGLRQPWSDVRLREARTLLEDIVDISVGREHEHIRTAIRELNRALEVR